MNLELQVLYNFGVLSTAIHELIDKTQKILLNKSFMEFDENETDHNL